MRSLVVFVAVLLCCHAADAQQRIVGPTIAMPGEEVRISVDGVKSPPLSDLDAIAKWAEKVDVMLDCPDGGETLVDVEFAIDFKNRGVKPRITFTPTANGLYFLVVNNANEGGGLSTRRIQVGALPVPIPPAPVEPPTPPAPVVPPAPFPAAGLTVVIIEETEQRSKLPADQLAILTSPKVTAWAKEHCQKLGTQSALRVLDADLAMDASSPKDLIEGLAAAKRDVQKAGGKLPWIVISNGVGGASQALPATVDETLALLDKFKKGN